VLDKQHPTGVTFSAGWKEEEQAREEERKEAVFERFLACKKVRAENWGSGF
jgi:hypothetical protein